MFALFGLCVGFYESDVADTLNAELYRECGEDYVKRFRSKERKVKKGRRPIKVRHWLAPEFAEIINAERARDRTHGTMFNSDYGTTLSVATIGDRWNATAKRAGVNLMFSQLRKMGYNAVKRLAKSKEGAELWDGHAAGVSGSYDDGIFEPVNAAERLWAVDLRLAGILRAS